MNMPTAAERRALRAQAHHLDPVVSVGQHGLTSAVLHEIDVALKAHELVKLRVFSDDRTVRNAMFVQICAAMHCAPVQHLGKVLVLWRPNPDRPQPAPAVAATGGRKPPGGRRAMATGGGPRKPVDPVRERRRGAQAERAVIAVGKGTRGAARNAPAPRVGDAPAIADVERRKSSFTPKTKPKSHSAKPNPRSAWERPPPATTAGTRQRRGRG
ncbi:MAG: YhbY family RNA-binding protein [Burkholderiales bacterium]|nr:YhbY family RNA-binding protein [Burkholderiales bacterium]